jgi:hypothetical protein
MGVFSNLLATPVSRIVCPLLPPKILAERPRATTDSTLVDDPAFSMRDGVDRSFALEFGSAVQEIWRDPLYRSARALSRGRSLLGVQKQMNLYLLIRFYLPALRYRNIVELGVWRGGNLLFMAKVLQSVDPEALVYGLDTFEGMPATDQNRDLHRSGDFADVAYPALEEAIKRAGLSNIRLIKGDVRETAERLAMMTPLGMAHIDLDIYDPIRQAQTILCAHMPSGGCKNTPSLRRCFK